jgi:hypothetical protein
MSDEMSPGFTVGAIGDLTGRFASADLYTHDTKKGPNRPVLPVMSERLASNI